MKRVGVVLAGGLGRRMGRPKADVRFRGASLAQRAASALLPVADTVVVSLAPGQENPVPGCRPVFDPPPGARGPLVGIDAAFTACGPCDLVVLACDYPLVDTFLLRLLVARAADEIDLVIPTDAGGRDHPLVGVWSWRARAPIAEAIASGRFRVGRVVDALRVLRLGIAELPDEDLARKLANANRPEDLEL